MLFNDDVLFIHVPKTAGMSITRYLQNDLPGEIVLYVPESAYEHARANIEDAEDIAPRLRLMPGKRHEDLHEALEILARHGKSLGDFKLILSAIRNPYDLEVSHFEHLRKPRVASRLDLNESDRRILSEGLFEEFISRWRYYGHTPDDVHRFWTVDGARPANLTLLRYETLSRDLRKALRPFSPDKTRLAHRNKTEDRKPFEYYLNARTEPLIYEKYRYLFEFYPRLTDFERPDLPARMQDPEPPSP